MPYTDYLTQARASLLLSDEALLINFGEEISDGIAMPSSKGQLKRNAQRWIADKQEELQNLICLSPLVQEMVTGEEVMLVAAIADVIAAKYGFTSPATLATMVVRIGIRRFCRILWEPVAK